MQLITPGDRRRMGIISWYNMTKEDITVNMEKDDYLEQVRASIEKIASEKPKTRIVVITDGKTPRQIDFIVQCARDNGLQVITESHADCAEVLRKELLEHLSTEAAAKDLHSPQDFVKELEHVGITEVRSVQDNRHRERRFQHEQMKLRKRFSNRKGK